MEAEEARADRSLVMAIIMRREETWWGNLVSLEKVSRMARIAEQPDRDGPQGGAALNAKERTAKDKSSLFNVIIMFPEESLRCSVEGAGICSTTAKTEGQGTRHG